MTTQQTPQPNQNNSPLTQIHARSTEEILELMARMAAASEKRHTVTSYPATDSQVVPGRI